MNRRVFLRSVFGAVAVGTSTWAFFKESAVARAMNSFVTTGEKEVANAPKTAHVFKTKSFKDVPAVKFLVIGDWGAGGSFQRSIAQQMLLKAEAETPQFIVSTGDNIYPNGVTSAEDKQWQTKFKNVYTGDALKLPWYAILGNHDYRLSAEAQVEYSKVDPQWNMPSRFFTFKKEFPDATNVEFTDSGKSYDELELADFPLALIVGNEITGIDDDVLKACDGAIEIPMYGVKHSLNVSVATGIVLFEAVRKWKIVNRDW